MKIALTTCISMLLLSVNGFTQNDKNELKAYQFYSNEGARITFGDAVEEMGECDIVLFGELHDNAMIHWLQLKTAQALSDKKTITLGGEMFETDNQLLIDEYLSGLVNDNRFEAEARLWPNYKTDYRPLLQLAREKNFRFIATNVPRRYASLVSQQGLDTLKTLSPQALELLPKLPIAFSMDTPGYPEMIEMMHGGGMGANFKPENFVMAQALKDATMAERILNNFNVGEMFLHFNGDYHSADYGGIYWYIQNMKPAAKTCTVKVFSADIMDFKSDWNSSGNIILVIPEDFTRTH